jgi:hypothetical protein
MAPQIMHIGFSFRCNSALGSIFPEIDLSRPFYLTPTRHKKTKSQFIHSFGQDIVTTFYQLCYSEKDLASLLEIRNDIDHGKIVELGSGMLRVLDKIAVLKAIVVDLALYLTNTQESLGGWLSVGVLDDGSEGLVILSAREAGELGLNKSGPVTNHPDDHVSAM